MLKVKKHDYWNTVPHQTQTKSKSGNRIIQNRHDFIKSVLDKYRKTHLNTLHILDAGCGDGLNLQVLCNVDNSKVYATDNNLDRCYRASQSYPNVHVSLSDLTTLNITEFYDVILCSQVLEHITEADKVLCNLYNALKPNGVLILGVPNEGCLLAQVRNRLLQFYISKQTDHVNFYTEDIIKSKLYNSKFDIMITYYESFFFPHTILNRIFGSFDIGYKLMQYLSNRFKSQVGGYYFVCSK